MSKIIEKKELLNKLEEAGFNVADASDFYSRETDGIWFKTGKTDAARKMLYNELSWDYGLEDTNPITDFLAPFGWFAEPYDSETLMAYKI